MPIESTATRMPRKLSQTSDSTVLRLVVTEEFLAELDEWRRGEPDLPNRSEAVRRLVKRAIAVQKPRPRR